MSFRRDDSVFFFTLIDFLVQILFFGLAFYAVVTYTIAKATTSDTLKVDRDKVRAVTHWTYAESIPALAEEFSSLSRPHDNFSKWAKFISSHDYDDVVLSFDLVKKAGGRSVVERALKGRDLPSCVAQDAGQPRPTSIARFRVTDDEIQLLDVGGEFSNVLRQLGSNMSVGQTVSLAEFRQRFDRIKQLHADCRYFASVKIETLLLQPRDTVSNIFYLTSWK